VVIVMSVIAGDVAMGVENCAHGLGPFVSRKLT